MVDQRTRLATLRRPRTNDDHWYRIANKRADESADIYIFDEIGMWGVTAKDFVDELNSLTASNVTLHINSPGGEVFDAIAIRNAIKAHPATVTAIVDGVAASAASFVATAGDEVVMNSNSEFMIHDPLGMAVGNADELDHLVGQLNMAANNIASMYAEKAGGTVEDWRTLMRAETWYTAEEAVAAGLADRVEEVDATEISDKFDFSIFNYAGRSAAPAPKSPAATASGQVEQKETDVSLIATLRQKLGIADDGADEAAVLAALDAALSARAAGDPQPGIEAQPENLRKLADAAGAVILDRGVWDDAQKKIQEGVAAAKKLREQERDVLLDKAVDDGRIPPANKAYWATLYDKDPKGTAQVIASLRKNLVPVAELGYAAGNDDDGLGEFASLFPKER